MQKGFTLVEIIISISIILVLTGIGSLSYSRYIQSARDNRRLTDLEEIRSALERYRSDNIDSVYPAASDLSTELQPGYIEILPTDPLNAQTGAVYTYTPSPPGCNNTTIYCLGYQLGAQLEIGGSYSVRNP